MRHLERLRFSRAIAFGVALSFSACSLFVDLDGLNDGGPVSDSGFDGSILEADSASDAFVLPPPDSAVTFDSGTPFDCDQIDATFCDDFNRDAALGSGVWNGINADPVCHLGVNGTLVTSVGASNASNCFLYSNDPPAQRHLSLEFDVTMTTTASSPAVVIAAIDNNLDSPSSKGVLSQYFQMLTLGTGDTKIGFLEYIPDAAASPEPGNSYPFWNLTDQPFPFLVPNTPCHVVLTIDTIASTASATAACEGHATNTLPSVDGGAPPGFIAKTQIELGYDNTGVNAPAWNVTYDNMVFRSTP